MGLVGSTVSHYKILEDLGGGGMSRVYRGVDLRLDREVVLKFLPTDQSADAESRERMIREAKAASSFDHPNICTVFDIDETDNGRLFIAMAFYRGETLEQRLARGPLPVEKALEVASEVLDGLAEAHAKGIVHRDIKPANLMLTEDGRVKILDFGVAKLKDQSGLTETGATVGTVAYISPEQLEGEAIDARTDLWSLGVVLYEMLTGRHPFAAESAGAAMRKILSHEPDVPSELRPEINEGVDQLLAAVLAKDRDARIADAATFARLLPIVARESGVTLAMPTMPGFRSRRRRRTWRTAAVVLALVAAALVWAWLASRPPATGDEPYAIAVMPFVNLTGQPEQDYLAEGISATLIGQLSELVGLRVLSRTETWSLAEEELPARELAAKLGIDGILEGNLQADRDRLRALISLTDGATATVVWSGTFARPRDEIFALQAEIAQRVAAALEIQLSAAERERLARDPTRSAQAYDLYLRGRDAIHGARIEAPSETDLRQATGLLEQAVDLDPGFALAHAGLSEALWWSYIRSLEPEVLAGAAAAAERALAIDPSLPAAIVARARVLRSTGQQSDSIEELRGVLASHPKPATAYRELAETYEQIGRLDDAEDALRMACAIDTDDWRLWLELGRLLARTGDTDAAERAEEAFRRAVELAPSQTTDPHVELATLALSRGRPEEAITVYEALPKPISSARVASNLGFAYYLSERPDKLRRAADAFSRAVRLRPQYAAYHRNLADVLAELGEAYEALSEYRLAYQLVGKELTANPNHLELQQREIQYGAKAGDCERVMRLAAERAAGFPKTAAVAHRMAGAYALCGQTDEALAALEQAVARGFPRDVIAQETEFESLRGTAPFERLVGEAR